MLTKKQIRESRPALQDRRLRLIHSGRLLTDGTLLYSWLETLEERQRRATFTSEAGDTPGHGGTASTIWLHCSVGPKLEPGEDEETKVQVSPQPD